MPRRRSTEVFSLSFLDVICCGFGAVVLFYTVVSAQSGLNRIRENESLAAESKRLEERVLTGYKYLAELRNTLQRTTKESVEAAGRARTVTERITKTQEELAKYEFDTLARREALERLKADLQSLEEDTRRLKAKSVEKSSGRQVRLVVGDGDRQYLTGLKVGGRRVLVLLDASASMLDETLVNVIRLRNMPDERKLRSEKWRQAIGTVDWISSQLPADGQFQMYTFNTAPKPLLAGSEGRWLDSKDGRSLGDALQALRRIVPAGGTSLVNAFAVIRSLNPAPDSVLLITDGLPTQGASAPLIRQLVDTEDRERLMQSAVKSLGPKPPPINVILLPMEGDPAAPAYFWALARQSGGAYLSPSRDWP
ncbi:MAG: hypothetical protein U1F14_08920 [Steroidobacteraceae bacterium]|mgnify:CR=1 FL=1